MTNIAKKQLNILQYLKTLDTFKKNKPTIILSHNEVFTHYHDYTVSNGILEIIYNRPNISSTLSWCVAFVNPEKIESIHVSETLCPNFAEMIDSIPEIEETSFVDYTQTIKDILSSCSTGLENYNVSILDKVCIKNGNNTCFPIELISILDDIYCLRSYTISVGHYMINYDKEIYTFENLSYISIELIDIKKCSALVHCTDEILTNLNFFLKSLKLDKIPEWLPVSVRKNKNIGPYRKGDIVKIFANNEYNVESVEYYISLNDLNSSSLKDEGSWKFLPDFEE